MSDQIGSPATRADQYLSAIAGNGTELPDAPVTRLDAFLAKLAGEEAETPEPVSRAEQYLQQIIDNGGTGGDVTLIELTANANGVYTPGTGKAYKKATVSVQPSLQNKTVTENGAVTADQGYDGLGTVTVNVSGGVTAITQAQWEALSKEQKRAYGLVAIIESAIGYKRGDLVNGADYWGRAVILGASKNSANVTISTSGNYQLVVLAINNESSNKNLVVTASQNESGLSGETLEYHNNSSGGENRRNYRIVSFNLSCSAGDVISINLSDAGTYSSFLYAVIEDVEVSQIAKALTTPDNVTTGTYSEPAIVFSGITKDSGSGDISVDSSVAGHTVSTADSGSTYSSSFIFWMN